MHLCRNVRTSILGMSFYDAISRINRNALQSPAVTTPNYIDGIKKLCQFTTLLLIFHLRSTQLFDL